MTKRDTYFMMSWDEWETEFSRQMRRNYNSYSGWEFTPYYQKDYTGEERMKELRFLLTALLNVTKHLKTIAPIEDFIHQSLIGGASEERETEEMTKKLREEMEWTAYFAKEAYNDIVPDEYFISEKDWTECIDICLEAEGEKANLELAKMTAELWIEAGQCAIDRLGWILSWNGCKSVCWAFQTVYERSPEGYFDEEDWINVFTLILLLGEAENMFHEAVNRYELQSIQASMYQPFYELYPELNWLEHSLQQTDLREEEIGNTEVIAQLLNAKYEEKADEFFNDRDN